MEFKARLSAKTLQKPLPKPAKWRRIALAIRRLISNWRAAFLISLALNLLLVGALIVIVRSNSTGSSAVSISGSSVSNVRFYIIDKDLNVKYQEAFAAADSINMSFGFNVDPANPQTYQVIMTKSPDTQVFNFEMPLTGNGERKFVLPRQGTMFVAGSYKVEIKDNQNRVIASNQFTVN